MPKKLPVLINHFPAVLNFNRLLLKLMQQWLQHDNIILIRSAQEDQNATHHAHMQIFNFKTKRPVMCIYFQSPDRHVYSTTVYAYLGWLTIASHSIN